MTEDFDRNKDSTTKDAQTSVGLAVVDCTGNYIGSVKDIQEGKYIVDRSLAHRRDLCVPFEACKFSAEQMELAISDREIDQQDWQAPKTSK